MTTGNRSGNAQPSDELAAAVNAGVHGTTVNSHAVEAYLAGVERALGDRLDARVSEGLRGIRPALPSHVGLFTGRAVGSIAVGIPLTAVAGAIAGGYGGGLGAVVGVLGALAAIVTLNVYYTEVEKDLEKERIRSGR